MSGAPKNDYILQ